jgi:NAD(P)-dependent dehydrogenase (short-subunit alcohol dehydrogenase family)
MREVPEGLTEGGGRVTDDVRLGAAYPTSKIAILAMTTQIAQELAEDNIVALTLNPGPAGTESFKHNARRFGFPLALSTPVSWPAEAVRYIATCDDPMAFAATYLDAVIFAQQHGLER